LGFIFYKIETCIKLHVCKSVKLLSASKQPVGSIYRSSYVFELKLSHLQGQNIKQIEKDTM